MSCINVEEAPQLRLVSVRFAVAEMELTVRCWSPREPWPPSPYSSSPLSDYFSLWLRCNGGGGQTILNFANAGFEIIERQIGHSLSDAGEIHSGERAGRPTRGGGEGSGVSSDGGVMVTKRMVLVFAPNFGLGHIGTLALGPLAKVP